MKLVRADDVAELLRNVADASDRGRVKPRELPTMLRTLAWLYDASDEQRAAVFRELAPLDELPN